MTALTVRPARHSARARAQAGFTLVETMIALAVFALIAINVALVTRTGAAAARTGTLISTLTGELDLTVERMELALMAAHAEEVQSINAFPLYSDRVDFAIDVGVDNGSVVLGDPERIAWSPLGGGTGRVEWLRNPDDPALQRAVTWSRSVPAVSRGEVAANGADDNDNGLLDEGGLAFTLPDERQDLVEIHLTVERQDDRGRRVPVSRRKRVSCRN